MYTTLELNAEPTDSTTRRALVSLSRGVVKRKRIVVVTGAGISCSSGIPDFRSSDGLYALVKAKYPKAILKGRDLFDAALFADILSTKIFFTFMSELKTLIDQAHPTPTHHFIKTLDTKGKLLRSYTQNIDKLEEKVGLSGRTYHDEETNEEETVDKQKKKGKKKMNDVRNVLLHGDIHRVRCQGCSASYPCSTEYIEAFQKATPPDCPDCTQRCNARVARSARALKIGSLRPAVVLYNESHPYSEDIGDIKAADMRRNPDLLIIMGTSLKVDGIKKLVKQFAEVVHKHRSEEGKVIYVNKDEPASEWNNIIDYWVSGQTDIWVAQVLEEWKKVRPQDWEIQTTLLQSGLSPEDGGFKVVKKSTAQKAKGGKKKKDPNAENVAPETLPSSITCPLPKAIVPPFPTPPLSPSKRKSRNEDVEGSPTKRRSVLCPVMPLEERGLLFQKPSSDSEDVFTDVKIKMPKRKVIVNKAEKENSTITA